MSRYPNARYFARARSRFALWLLLCASGFGVIVWFLVANRSPVEVVLPFGFGTRSGPVSIVIFVSMAMGAFWTLLIQGLLAARRHLRELYRKWSRPRSDIGHRCEPPHIVRRTIETSMPAAIESRFRDGRAD